MYIDLATDRGDVTIEEHELLTITDDDLAMLGISREDLLRCFEEGRHSRRPLGRPSHALLRESYPLMNEPPAGSG